MARVIFQKGQQSKWLNKLLHRKSVNELAHICGVSPRTVRDWKKEKYTITDVSLLVLSKRYNIQIPKDIKYVNDFWYVTKGARKGALKRLELYGPLGTVESRRKGGQISQQRRRKDPEKYRLLGCNVRKNFKALQPSEELAEVTGVILGDGGITNSQLRITLDRKTDRSYGLFIRKLMLTVFGELPAWYEHEKDNTIDLCISGVNLIEELSRWGLEKGDKIMRQVDFPSWIWSNKNYQKACIRGLVDTDGGIYFHKHWTKGIRYRNLGLCFTSHSRPLITSVSKALSTFAIKHSIKQYNIFIYSLDQIKKYFQIIGFSNPKHPKRLYYHLTNSKILDKIV